MTPLPLDPDQLALLKAVDQLGPDLPEAAELRAVGAMLRDCVSGGVDVADDVMFALSLNDAVGGGVDVADDVMFALALNDAVGGGVDVADDVMLALALNDAVGGGVDVADDVMFALALNDAVGGGVDVADDVMAAIGAESAAPVQPVVVVPAAGRDAEDVRMPRWASLGGGAALFAMAAAMLFTLVAGPARVAEPAVELQASAALGDVVVAQFNSAEVEAIETADDSTVSVMQFEEDGPTIIFVEEG